jgi:hypothetical protein
MTHMVEQDINCVGLQTDLIAQCARTCGKNPLLSFCPRPSAVVCP